ncbi:MAG: hypothetical protein M3P44_17135 [Actinomycetota bacterium]|nr:hypothetical protein [Actinomycetota bacterium]
MAVQHVPRPHGGSCDELVEGQALALIDGTSAVVVRTVSSEFVILGLQRLSIDGVRTDEIPITRELLTRVVA